MPSKHLVLPTYTLDLALVLLPGLVYNVTFTRFKAAAFLSRFRGKVGHLPLVKTLLAEYDFDADDSDSPHISEIAAEGIRQFCAVEQAARKDSAAKAQQDQGLDAENELDWVVVAVFPNLSKINANSAPETTTPQDQVATVCRLVGITDDSAQVRLTLQAVVRAAATPNPTASARDSSFPNEGFFLLKWSEKSSSAPEALKALQRANRDLFVHIDAFLELYQQALAADPNRTDLLALHPLANALFLQLGALPDFEKAYRTLQKLADEIVPSLRGLLRLVDLTTAIIPLTSQAKLQILVEPSLTKRAAATVVMVDKISQVFQQVTDNSAVATRWFHDEASNIQKAKLVANQLKLIRLVLEGLSSNKKQLVRRKPPLNGSNNTPPQMPGLGPGQGGGDDDSEDLNAITDFVQNKLPKITTISDDSKRLIVKDFKRVKKSSAGNADYHVIRNYLEVVADIPWDRYVAKFKDKDIDIVEAKRQLDEDHHGLEHVKQRLIQYLVVLRLLGLNAETKYKADQELQQERLRKEQMESRKFTRESANGEAIILPNDSKKASVSEEERTPNQEAETKALMASKNNKSPIIMLAGPPGVGKTSLAKSIATTLGRTFQRISLGGVKDESEIRGHRRTYVGAMAGNIVQALRKARSMNPVILLDEIDKIMSGAGGNRVNGDPEAALLEVLDPEQNTQFMDHYLGFPIDLSQVIFICTANEPHNLSRPLLDRLEMIDIGAYDYQEKLVIGQKYLMPRQMRRNGFPDESLVVIPNDVMQKVILGYTREAGVRNLERLLGTICRFKAVEYSKSLEGEKYNANVEDFDLARYLGMPHMNLSSEIIESPLMASRYGVVNGLSYNTDGSGSVLVFESIGIDGKGGLHMTGRLGEVLMESAKIGLTFIKTVLQSGALTLENTGEVLERLNKLEIHMHVPSGAVSKDGPSAGITMALLFLSLALKRPVPTDIAMTGEITLRGLVLPIGGLREKMLGAHLTGHITKIIVPRANRRDILEEYVRKINAPHKLNALLKDDASTEFLDSSPEDYFADKYGVRIVYAKEFWDVVRHVWGEDLLSKVEQERLEHYHL